MLYFEFQAMCEASLPSCCNGLTDDAGDGYDEGEI